MDFKNLLDSLMPVLGQTGIALLEADLKSLASEQDTPWKKAALALLADAVYKHGPAGIDLAHKAVMDLLENKVPEIDWADPRTASDLVAALQNAEADDKSAAKDFFHKTGNILGRVLGALVQGMLTV